MLGKFLGMMMYGLLMFSVLLVYVILGGCWIESFDWAAVLTGCWVVPSFRNLCGNRSVQVHADDLPDRGGYLYVGFVDFPAFRVRAVAGIYFCPGHHVLAGLGPTGRYVY